MKIQHPHPGACPGTEGHPGPLPRQGGAALALALIVLTALTIVGLSSMRSTSLQEKAADSYDQHQVAGQSAEGGVQTGEDLLHEVFIGACLEQTTPLDATCLADGETMSLGALDSCLQSSSDCANGLCATADAKDWLDWNEAVWTTSGKYRELSSYLSSVVWGVSPIAGIEPRFLVRSLNDGGPLPCDPSDPEALRVGSRDDDTRMTTATRGLGGFDVLAYYFEVVSRYGNFGGSGQNIADAVTKSTYAVPNLK
jgi:Tfp pilus assembly protein PilX